MRQIQVGLRKTDARVSPAILYAPIEFQLGRETQLSWTS